MTKVLRLLMAAIATVVMAYAQPQITAVANAASFAAGTVVPGSIATIFGTNLTLGGTQSATTFPLQTSLEGVSVQMQAPPKYKTVSAVLLYVSPKQLNFVVPWGVATGLSPNSGAIEIQVTLNGVASGYFSVWLASAQPGVFMYDGTFAAVRHANYTPVNSQSPASPSEVILIYCTGLGAVKTAQQDGVPATGAVSTVVTPVVTIAGLLADVLYSGVAPDYVGLYQLNVRIPKNAPVGAQSISITMPDVVTASNSTNNISLVAVGTVGVAGTSVAVSPTSVSLMPGSTHQFSATVNGSTDKIVWTASVGKIDSNGNYTAPAVTPNPNYFSVVATAANGASGSAVVTVQYATPVITSISPSMIYADAATFLGTDDGALQIHGSGFAPGSVFWTCIGSGCGGITIPQGNNPTTYGWNADFDGSSYNPGWYDYYVVTPDGKKSNVKSIAFVGSENLSALSATRAFGYDSSGVGFIRRWNLADGLSDGAFTWGSAPASIAIDDLTGFVLIGVDAYAVLGGFDAFIQDPPPVDFGGGVTNYFPDAGTSDGNATTSIVAKSGIACVAEPAAGQVACASLTGLASVNYTPPMTPATVGKNPWPMVMTRACVTGELDGFTYSRDDQTLWKFVAEPGSTPGTVTTTAKGSLALSGFALPANLYLAGGWYLVALEPSSGGCTIALLAPKVDVQNNLTFSVVFFDGATMQQIAIADKLPQASFRLAADNAHDGVVVAYADPAARLTRFVKVDTAGKVTQPASTTDILAVGVAVSSDGTSIYGAMRDQFRTIPNK